MAKNKRRLFGILAFTCLLAAQGELIVRAQRSIDPTRTKSSDTLRTVFTKAIAEANKSTVMVRSDDKGTMRQISLGTVVSADGFVLTKGSEVIDQSKVWVTVKKGNASQDYVAKIVGWSATLDLAMLKIDATGLVPVVFADTRPPAEAVEIPPPPAPAAGRGVPGGAPGGQGAPGAGGRRGGRGTRGGANGTGPSTQPAPDALGGPNIGGGRGIPGAGGPGAGGPDTQPAPGAGGGRRGRGGGGGGQGGPGARGRSGRGFGPPDITETPEMPKVMAPTTLPAGALRIDVGEWVATASPAGSMEGYEEPIAVGVVSVKRRRIAGRNGFLGVSLADADNNTGAKIMQVIPESAAEKAGVKLDDVITGVNGKPTKNRVELITIVQGFSPGEEVTLNVQRGDQALTLKATLGVNNASDSPEESEMQKLMGAVNKRASDFPAVIQHDTVIRPVECGGPLVDLDGHVVGINIARAGRTETYALPADMIVPLIEPMKSGKLAPVAGNSPKDVPGEKPSTMPTKGE